MNLSRRRWTGAGILGAAGLLGLLWIANLDFASKISTDVLDLLPKNEREPEMAIVRALAGDAEARVMYFVLTDGSAGSAPEQAAVRFAATLAKDPAFEQALSVDDPGPREALAAGLFEARFTLLFPHWLRERELAFAAAGGNDAARFPEWLATETAAALTRFLDTPEALAFQDLLPADPLLLMPGAAARMQGGLALAGSPGESGPAQTARVWARIAASPLTEEGQTPVFAAIEKAAAAVRADYPGLAVAYTGVNRFAAASKARIQHELSWLNSISLAAVFAVALTFIPRAHRALHLAGPVLLATLGAWVCVTIAFPRVHILVFVIGALLTGVAVDYGFYLYMQAPDTPGEDYAHKVRRLGKPLLSSCFTTVAGFALLLFSELPLIRQLGSFVAAGLVCALGAAIVYFSMLEKPFLEARTFRGPGAIPAGARRSTRRILVALWIVALPGLFRLTWKDDIRQLEIPAPALQREDASIRAQFGDQGDKTVYLTHGTTLVEARESLERLDSWLRASGVPQSETFGMGALVPTIAEGKSAAEFMKNQPGFPSRLRATLESGGFDASAFEPFFEAYQARARLSASDSDPVAAAHLLQQKLFGPLSMLIHSGTGGPAWYVTLANRAPDVAPPPEARTVTASQLQSLNRLFSRYRQSALWLSLTGLAIVGAGVFFAYGMKDGARIFAIPCGACLGLFGVFGWLGVPLNLFHLLGAFLGVCLTHNYSIFSATSAYRREAPPVSVRLSALTAAASFGALAFSGIPVVRALGETVALMVLAALVVIEFEHFSPFAEKS